MRVRKPFERRRALLDGITVIAEIGHIRARAVTHDERRAAFVGEPVRRKLKRSTLRLEPVAVRDVLSARDEIAPRREYARITHTGKVVVPLHPLAEIQGLQITGIVHIDGIADAAVVEYKEAGIAVK